MALTSFRIIRLGSNCYLDKTVLFFYNPGFAQIPIHLPHSHVPEEVDLSSNAKGGLNGLRVTAFPLQMFASGVGMKPNFAQ